MSALSTPAFSRELGVRQPENMNLYGQVGLLDMPTARFAADGELGFTVSSMRAQDRYTALFQVLPWLEAAFRYSRVDSFTPHFDLYDRSLSFKIRLSRDTGIWPALAVGVQDVLGTGAFGAEYLVATKRVGPLDLTLGMGWRRFGGLATFENPFGLIFKSFKTTPTGFGLGGTPSLNKYFHGPNVGLFGGIVWRTPIDRLSLILEASGDRYEQQRSTGAINYRTPFNFGLSYEVLDGFQIGVSYLYGSQLGLRATFHMNAFDTYTGARLGAPPPIPVTVRTPEQRADAVLDLLQDKLHVYDVYKKPVEMTSVAADMAIADMLYSGANFANLKVQDVETYGRSLIVEVSGPSGTVSCDSLARVTGVARAAKFDEIVLSSDRDSQVTFCNTKALPGPDRVQYASNHPVGLDAGTGGGEVIEPRRETEAEAETSQMFPSGANNDAIEKTIRDAATAQRILISAIWLMPRQIEVAYYNGRYLEETAAVGRLLRILLLNTPPDVEQFRLVAISASVPTLSLLFDRSDVERTLNLNGSAQELLPLTRIQAVSEYDPLLTQHDVTEYPAFNYTAYPGFRDSLFDPNNPFQYQFYANLGGSVALDRHFSFAGSFEFNIFNTFDFRRVSNSQLPHVRSDFLKYYRHGINGLAYLQASYIGKLSPEVYVMARAGLLESMFGGFGGEIFWQPTHQRWALGASLYAVRQRGFQRLFSFRDYKVITGHLSLYYDSPFHNLDFAIHAGRYLAGDYGATFQVTRRFSNGIEIGAYVTLTNVPFSKFGEGSFDKGIIIHIPIGDLFPVESQDEVHLDFSPITRDGGQKLAGESVLHDAVRRSSESELMQNWGEVLHP